MRLRRRRPSPASASPPSSVDDGRRGDAAVLAETMRQVRRVELRTRGLVTSRFSGEYHSVFKGQGMEFVEVREYLPGDDVRSIDWNVSARTGVTHVKKFVEERELTVLLAVDLSGSQRFGTRGRFKSEMVAEIAATLAMSAVRNNDRVAMLAFTDRVEAFVPPRKGRRHVLRIVRDLLVLRPTGRGTDVAAALEYGARLLRSRSIVFLVSDFQGAAAETGFERALAAAAHRHDVVAVRVTDPADVELPDAGVVAVTDPETGETAVVHTGDRGVRARFAAAVAEERDAVRSLFRRLGVDTVELRTDEPWAAPLLAFFRRREGRPR